MLRNPAALPDNKDGVKTVLRVSKSPVSHRHRRRLASIRLDFRSFGGHDFVKNRRHGRIVAGIGRASNLRQVHFVRVPTVVAEVEELCF